MKVRPLKDYKEMKKQLGDTTFHFDLDKMEFDEEPQIGDVFEGTDEYVENRAQSYEDFLKSDIGRQIMEIEVMPYQGDID